MKKLLPPILLIIFVVIISLSAWLTEFIAFISFPYNLLGLPLSIAGLALSATAKNLFSKIGTNINTFSEPGVLVKRGAFKYSRNPMYLGFTIALLGISVLFGATAYTLAPVALFIFICTRWYIAFEEKAMQQKFGNDYKDYCRAVRRWI